MVQTPSDSRTAAAGKRGVKKKVVHVAARAASLTYFALSSKLDFVIFARGAQWRTAHLKGNKRSKASQFKGTATEGASLGDTRGLPTEGADDKFPLRNMQQVSKRPQFRHGDGTMRICEPRPPYQCTAEAVSTTIRRWACHARRRQPQG